MKDIDQDINSIYRRFVERHDAVNRWFRSTEITKRLCMLHIEGEDKAKEIIRLFPKDRRRMDTIKQYRGRFKPDGERAKYATIADLHADLYDSWPLLLELVIVKEVGALEMFLRDWALIAINVTVNQNPKSIDPVYKNELIEIVEQLKKSPHITVSLGKLSSIFPTIKATLEATTHRRSESPLLSPATGTLTCRAVAELWRSVRNLIVHEDGIVNQRFLNSYSEMWINIQKDASKRGCKLIPRKVYAGVRLPIVVRHVVFCLTSCYQTAVVLYLAAGGKGLNEP